MQGQTMHAATGVIRALLGVALAMALVIPGLVALSSTASAAASIPTYTSNLFAVACPSRNICQAVGSTRTASSSSDGIAIYGTTDGGSIWRQEPLPEIASGNLRSIACPTTSLCIAVGWEGNGALLLRTTDGGATWNQVSAPQTMYSLASVVCPSATMCEAVGQSIRDDTFPVIGSTDGGATWTQPSDPGENHGPLTSISCPSTSVCFAVGVTAETTTDGGNTWSQVENDEIFDQASITCTSTTTCLAVGAGYSRQPTVFSTTDGWSSWNRKQLGSDGTLYAITCPTATTCVAVGTKLVPQGGFGATSFTTTDGGESWTEGTTPSWATLLSDVACPTATDCIGVGITYPPDSANIVRSSDAGSNWTVALSGTKTSIDTSNDPSPPGPVTFSATVSAAPGFNQSGTVTFVIDKDAYGPCSDLALKDSTATCTVTLKAGTEHSVQAAYTGDATSSGSQSGVMVQHVNPSTTTLPAGTTLTADQSLTAAGYRLTMQSDGDLVEYQGSRALWASGTAGHPGAGVAMQQDGDLVEYFQDRAIWASNTSGHPDARLVLQGSDGNVVIYEGSTAIWATRT